MLKAFLLGAIISTIGHHVTAECPDYSEYSKFPHEPLSSGKYKLSYMRPKHECRTFILSEMEDTILEMKNVIHDPDLYRLFENSFPNTLDTAIKWKGVSANNSKEELTFIVTGDIKAMWLRDSANQLLSYRQLLKANSSTDSLASLYRGLINLQARYINTAPFCNSFQAPLESGLQPSKNQDNPDRVYPPVDNKTVFECKFELDSLAAFLEISSQYYETTGDIQFFRDFQWVSAVKTILTTVKSLLVGTYSADGSTNPCPYKWERQTSVATETLSLSGCGNPVQDNTGLIRSAFRPSDDATIFQLFIPANMMFSSFLDAASNIMMNLGTENELADHMHQFSLDIRTAITKHAIVHDAIYGDVYAYEVDGYGGINRMDDANIPSLLSIPLLHYLNSTDNVYQNTRRYVLSKDNPYFMRGPVINAIGGPHVGPAMAWPMASIVRIMTTDDDAEVTLALKEIISSTAGLGLIHESVYTFDQTKWTRQWFGWANGLFGECLLDLKVRKNQILNLSFQ